jgi:hypothetical protein
MRRIAFSLLMIFFAPLSRAEAIFALGYFVSILEGRNNTTAQARAQVRDGGRITIVDSTALTLTLQLEASSDTEVSLTFTLSDQQSKLPWR